MPDTTSAQQTDMDYAVRLRGVAKHYPLYGSLPNAALHHLGLHRLLPARLRRPPQVHAALDGVELTIRKGEKVGILGRNGAGKTTMLKLITGNFEPTQGTVEVQGEIKALMSMGIGFHPEFTGRENIRSSLLYNGLDEAQLNAAMEDVIEFVELGEYLDQPVRTYSLGMQARLQFACATAIRPDIVIVDEVLGAGDSYFNAKCADRIQRLSQSGCTFLLVSHNMAQVIQYCDRAVWLRDGRIAMDGPVIEVVGAYEVYMEREAARHLRGVSAFDHGDTYTTELADGRQVHRWPATKGIKICELKIQESAATSIKLRPRDSLSFSFSIVAEETDHFICDYILTFWRIDGKRVARIRGPLDDFNLAQGEIRPIRVMIDEFPLETGSYYVSFSIYDRKNFVDTLNNSSRLDFLARAVSVQVDANEGVQAIFTHPVKWATSAFSK